MILNVQRQYKENCDNFKEVKLNEIYSHCSFFKKKKKKKKKKKII